MKFSDAEIKDIFNEIIDVAKLFEIEKIGKQYIEKSQKQTKR